MTVPHPKSSRTGRYLLRGLLGLGLVVLCRSGLDMLPVGYKPFTHGSPQRECKANLKSWFTAQRGLWQEKDSYSTSNALTGFSPERGNRYAYFSGPGPLEDRSTRDATGQAQAQGVGVDLFRHPGLPLTFRQMPREVALRLGLSGTCPQCNITLACLGQLDEDETLDVWTVSTADRTAPDGTLIPQGQPFNDVNDLEQ